MTALTQNDSGLKPLGKAVLVKPYVEEVKKKSLIALPEPVKERALLLEQKATVVEVGEMAWDNERASFLGIPLWKKPRARCGDIVILAQFSGYLAVGPADGIQYRMVNCNDIFAAVTREAQNGN
jgi:co-chaperonin GroES (HSP10)